MFFNSLYKDSSVVQANHPHPIHHLHHQRHHISASEMINRTPPHYSTNNFVSYLNLRNWDWDLRYKEVIVIMYICWCDDDGMIGNDDNFIV